MIQLAGSNFEGCAGHFPHSSIN